jgi:ribosome modulation factor
MSEEQELAYKEGYNAFLNNEPSYANPYDELLSEYWDDGWSDAEADELEKSQ